MQLLLLLPFLLAITSTSLTASAAPLEKRAAPNGILLLQQCSQFDQNWQEISFYSSEAESKQTDIPPYASDRTFNLNLKDSSGHMGNPYYEVHFFDNWWGKRFGQQAGTAYFHGQWYRLDRDNGRVSQSRSDGSGSTINCVSQFYAY
ncbi:hypothetical protein HDU97_005926 [Phlyctochytrium planicorne]|nr:hypothetical protein HDU97_005926 [Phlyctochytrium planicorne]